MQPEDTWTEQRLRQTLYRFDCPSPHVLGEYDLGLLGAQERTSIARHATGCDDCLAELQMLRAYLAAPISVAPSVGERARRVVASLLAPRPGLALGGLRGSAQTSTRVFEAEDVVVSIDSAQARGTLIGLVVVNAATHDVISGRHVRVLAADGSGASAVIDDLGNFEFSDIQPGVYALELELSDRVVVIGGLPVD